MPPGANMFAHCKMMAGMILALKNGTQKDIQYVGEGVSLQIRYVHDRRLL